MIPIEERGRRRPPHDEVTASRCREELDAWNGYRRKTGYVSFQAGLPLRRDMQRVANAEGRSLSQTTCALVRLGLHRYFELAGENVDAATIRAAMETAGEWS